MCTVYRKAWKWVRVEMHLSSEQAKTEVDASCLGAFLKLLYEKDLWAVPDFFVYSWWLWRFHLMGTSKFKTCFPLSCVLQIGFDSPNTKREKEFGVIVATPLKRVQENCPIM